MIKSICIVRLSALGDVLMLVPLVRTLQVAFPKATITWVISQPAAYLVEGLTGVELIVIKKPQSIADFYQFKRRMSAYHFDVLLATQASFRANLLYPLISATRKIGYDRLRAKDGHGWFIREAITPGCDHTLEGFLKFAVALGVHTPKIQWDLSLTQEDRALAQFILPLKRKLTVVVNPAASKPERSWLVERYIAVIQYLQTVWDAHVVLTGGPSDYDRQLGEQITAAVKVTNVIGQTQPKQLLALIQMADLMICPDTGPSHMAVAVGTAVVALHAVTSAEVSGPYTWRHWAVDFYPMAVEKILKKKWPNQPWGMHAHGAETMSLVTLAAVKARLDEVIPLLSSDVTDPLKHK